jgi:hypothetical protein
MLNRKGSKFTTDVDPVKVDKIILIYQRYELSITGNKSLFTLMSKSILYIYIYIYILFYLTHILI